MSRFRDRALEAEAEAEAARREEEDCGSRQGEPHARASKEPLPARSDGPLPGASSPTAEERQRAVAVEGIGGPAMSRHYEVFLTEAQIRALCRAGHIIMAGDNGTDWDGWDGRSLAPLDRALDVLVAVLPEEP